MFRITKDLVQCLAKNYKNGSILSVDMEKVGVTAACVQFTVSEGSAFRYSELHTRTTGQNMLP